MKKTTEKSQRVVAEAASSCEIHCHSNSKLSFAWQNERSRRLSRTNSIHTCIVYISTDRHIFLFIQVEVNWFILMLGPFSIKYAPI